MKHCNVGKSKIETSLLNSYRPCPICILYQPNLSCVLFQPGLFPVSVYCTGLVLSAFCTCPVLFLYSTGINSAPWLDTLLYISIKERHLNHILPNPPNFNCNLYLSRLMCIKVSTRQAVTYDHNSSNTKCQYHLSLSGRWRVPSNKHFKIIFKQHE